MLKLADATAEQIAGLNAYQTSGRMHAFTCPERGDGAHRIFNGDLGALVATRRGWICSWCDYTQDWAHPFMAEAVASVPLPQAADSLIAISAFRYALGRMTYMVGHVAAWLIANAAVLSEHERGLIVREIDEAERLGRTGMACDLAEWARVRAVMSAGAPGADAS